MKSKLMNSTLAAAVFVGALAVIPTMTVSTPAVAREAFVFSFNAGDVGLAYRNGYYDRHRVWHTWRDEREAREFRARYRGRWHDEDHDGVPDRVDRDRDGDGVPNRFDSHPDNSFRR